MTEKNYTPQENSKVGLMIAALKKLPPGQSLRTADLAALVDCNPNYVASLLDKAVKTGLLVSCSVRTANNRPTNEYRIGSGIPPVSRGDLKLGKRGLEANSRRAVGSQPPKPEFLPPLKTSTPLAKPSAPIEADTALLHRVQAMADAEFIDFVTFLLRLRSWARVI